MIRFLRLAPVLPMLLAASSPVRGPAAVCGGVTRWHAVAFDSLRQVGFGEYT